MKKNTFINNPVTGAMTRRDFVKTAAAATAGLAATCAWPTPLRGATLNIRLRQDYVGDGIMDYMIRGFNGNPWDIKVASSYVNSDMGWGYEKEHAHETPAWYTEGEPCQLFMARGPALAQLADDGVIAPLDDFLEQSERLSRDDFHKSRYGSVLDSATYRNSLWGIPFIGNTYALFCNMDLFAAGGVESPPQTWEQTIEAARAMTRDTDGDGAPDVFGYSQCSFQFPLQLLTAGLPLVDMEAKRAPFDSDEALEALDTYRRCTAFSPPHVNFENGDMGMKISVTTNSYGRYKDINHITVPLPAGARRANTYGDSDGITVFAISATATPDEQAAAWKFIEYISGEKTYFKMLDTVRNLPLRHSILEGEKYAAYLDKYPVIRAFAEELEYAVPKPCIPEYRYLEVIMREILYVVQTAEDRTAVTQTQMRDWLKKQSDLANERLARATW